jgi:hypothetical protein
VLEVVAELQTRMEAAAASTSLPRDIDVQRPAILTWLPNCTNLA